MINWKSAHFEERLVEQLQLEVYLGRVTLSTYRDEFGDTHYLATLSHVYGDGGPGEIPAPAIHDVARGDGTSVDKAIRDLADQLIHYHTPEELKNGAAKA
ncbi:hypothetical protein Mbo2_057 [Rhodococcus phage Mbo2]|uniref:Uncharacterized protein n=1 Tax=Rhodococcus phage Mbo2 TaxID=2936911 RepID=A0A9E7L9X5_9CAUD|nr:hypothetical protein Mbo2_057 [Rhodococcus phage Mbo2]